MKMRTGSTLFLLAALLFCRMAGVAAGMEMSWPPSVVSPDFLPGCAELLLENPTLFEGGGVVLKQGEMWLALGVGTAVVSSVGSQRPGSGGNEWRRANDGAFVALAEVFRGIRLDTGESLETRSATGGEKPIALTQITSSVGREREDILARSWEAGRWRLRDGAGNSAEVGVLRIVASPGHPLTQAAGRITVASDTLDPAWRDEVLSRPMLRHGGVALVLRQGETWFLTAGCVEVPKGVSRVPPARMRMAEDKARSEWLQFSEGVLMRNHEEFIREALVLQHESGENYESISKTLSSVTKSRIHGQTQGMIPVGMWLSDAGTHWRLAAVFRLSLENSLSEDHIHAMTRPPVPQTTP